MKTNLFEILWKKEIKHWKRLVELFRRINNWFIKLTYGILLGILLTAIHYAFVVMHTLYEMVLFVFAPKAFKANIQRMALTV